MPIHPHLTNLPVLRLTEDRPARIHLFARATAPERAAKLGCKPRPCRVDLTGRKCGLGLKQRDILPIRADGGHPSIWTAEGRLEKDGVLREDRADDLDVPPLPTLAEGVDQDSKGFLHGAPI